MMKFWSMLVVLVFGAAVLVGCGGDDDSAADGSTSASDDSTKASDDSASAGDTSDDSSASESTDSSAAPSASSGVVTLGDEEITIDRVLCYFKEQPRAGLGGIFTHTAQAHGTNPDGEQVIVDMSRAKAEDGTIEVDVLVDIGDPFSADAVGLRATGGDELVAFGDNSVTVDGVEVTDFETQTALLLDVALSCG